MRCPACGAPRHEVRVIQTDYTEAQVRRRRECLLCKQRFSTVEIAVKDGQRTTKKDLVMLPEGVRDALTST